LLIGSVRREVQQREQLQKLTTELANANEKLKALDQARAEFISIASHQLRTPPATVKWYLAALVAGDYGKVPQELMDPLKKKLQFTYNPPSVPLPPVMADKEKLRQVMNNLIDNALKYTKSGTVTVKIFLDGENIRFEVKDSGKGISAEDRAAIFQKYTRGKE